MALIGDLVGSRESLDRQTLHTTLDDVLRDVNQRLEPIVPAVITVGDEFQAVFDDVASALRATWVNSVGLAGAFMAVVARDRRCGGGKPV